MDQIWAILWAVDLGWAIRIWYLHLGRRHPFLVCYLCLSTVNSLVASFIIQVIGQESRAYAWMWMTMRPVLWLLLLLVLIECFAHSLGLKRIGRNAVLGVVGLSCLLTAVAFIFSNSVYLENFWIRSEQSIYLILIGVEALLIGLTVKDPIRRMERNDMIVYAVFGLLAGAHVGVISLRNISGWIVGKKARYEIMAGLYAGLPMLGAVGFRGRKAVRIV